MPAVNIVAAVDTVSALSGGTLLDNIRMTDDGALSRNKGTARLETACARGQIIHWRVLAVDVQTPALIAGLSFLPHGAEPAASSGVDPHPERYAAARWKTCWLTVPCDAPLGLHPYRLAVQMGSGPRSIVFIDGPALDVAA